MSSSVVNLPAYGDPHSSRKSPLSWCQELDLAIWLCAFANFINSADRVIMPIAITSLSTDNDYTLVQQGWILSAFPAGYISSQIIGSCISSRWSSRRVLFIVVMLWSLSTVVTPFVASSFYLLVSSRIILGLGEGFGLPTMYHILAEGVPVNKRTSAFAYLTASGSAGQTIAAIICPLLYWKVNFYVFGCLGLYWCLLWNNSNVGLNSSSSSDSVLLLHKVKSPFRSWDRFIRLSPLLAIYVAHFCMNWTAYVIMHWLPTYLRLVFSADPSAISLAALPYVINTVMSIGTGHAVDSMLNSGRISLRNARIYSTVLGLVLPAAFLVAFAFVKNVYLAIILISMSMGALAFNAAGHLSNHVDVAPKFSGITFAISNTIATLPGLTVGPLTAHLVISSAGLWWPSFIIAAVLNVIGSVIYIRFACTEQIL
ncbi:hypothetical protein AB6A40_005356 [Gnathostoma spinigerum]|uniref:Major facilitator superfamily (MFS) profile domain-containing protein n=1 Tax=Gnathostoma spinigerum TaxID=75299 RepID=A0ABD6EPP4_9BILA